MEPMTGMLARDPGTGAMNAIDLRDPRVQAAVKRLQAAGLPVNRVSIQEELAAMPTVPPLVAPPQAAPMVRTGPASSFADPAEVELELRRAEQQRIMQEAIQRERARRMQATGGQVVR